jgi:hypothetical protein
MDETRAQAYLQLIQTLLTYPNGEENQILNANSELVDAELVQTMVAVAAQLSENNQENEADFLLDIASELANLLGINNEKNRDNSQGKSPSGSTELEFLVELLILLDIFQEKVVIYSMIGQRQHHICTSYC